MGELVHDHDILVKNHLEPEAKRICGYCGKAFDEDEIVIEREIHGRMWKFCSDECYHDFEDALDFKDEDLDSYEAGSQVQVHHDPED